MTSRPVSGSVADPLQDEPAVVPREVLGVGQPGVDDGEAARREVRGERRDRGRWSARVPIRNSELSGDRTRAERAGVGQPDGARVALHEA